MKKHIIWENYFTEKSFVLSISIDGKCKKEHLTIAQLNSLLYPFGSNTAHNCKVKIIL